jgi:hypothetical protein
VACDAVANFPRQIEPHAVVLEDVDDAKALLVVIEPAWHELVDDALTGVAERRVPQVVPEGDRLSQLSFNLVLGDAARDLGTSSVGQPVR